MTCRTLDCVRWVLLALRASLACLAAPVAGAQTALDSVVETFIAITERAEFGDKAIGVTRWSRPIRIATAGQPTADQAEALTRHVARLQRHTGLAMELVPPLAASTTAGPAGAPVDIGDGRGMFQIMYHLPAHGWTTYLVHGVGEQLAIARGELMVIFAEHRSVAQIARILRLENQLVRQIASGDIPCFAHFHTEASSHEIKYGIVTLRTDVPEWMRRRCLHEELTQVLGLRNDVKNSEITLFDDAPAKQRTELTAHDWLFLETLYDPRLKLGSRGKELRRVARELIAERWPPR